jgi:hypothetical protein
MTQTKVFLLEFEIPKPNLCQPVIISADIKGTLKNDVKQI